MDSGIGVAPQGGRGLSRGSRKPPPPLRLLIRSLTELCLTIGTLIVLFVAYVLFWTGVKADAAMDDQIDRLQETWAQSEIPAPADSSTPPGSPSSHPGDPGDPGSPRTPTGPSPDTAVGGSGGTPYRDGSPFAVMYVPRLGDDWSKPVLEGTATGTLKKGLGHYADTTRLGGKGNFAVAGHRRTYGDPFKDFPRLRPGDAVVLTDGARWFTYRIDVRPYRTVPTDTGVVDPLPPMSPYREPGRYLTLTTCDPEWGHSHRLVVWAHLDATHSVADGEPPALTGSSDR